MNRLSVLGIVLGCLLSLLANSQPVLEADRDFTLEAARPYLSMMGVHISDTSAKALDRRLLDNRWRPVSPNAFMPRRADSAYWMRLRVSNRSQQPLWAYSSFDGIHVYRVWIRQPGGALHAQELGALHPYRKRAIQTNMPVFAIPQNDSVVQEVFILLHFLYAPNVQLKVATPASFVQRHHSADLLAGLYLGLVLLILFYNGVTFYYLRDRSNIIYMLWITVNALALFAYHGVAFEYLWPSNPILNAFVDVYTCLAVLLQVLLSFTLFNLRKHSRFFTRSCYAVVLLALFCIASHLFGFSNQVFPLSDAGVVVLVNGLNTIALSIAMVRRHQITAWYYLLGNLFLFLFLMTIIGLAFSDQETILLSPMNLSFVGSAVEIMFFTMALVSRIRLLKRKQEAAEQENYRLLQEKEQMMRQQNEVLEAEVAERTREIRLEKKKSDDLLLNILPEETAEEIKVLGFSKPRLYEQVTVMFADFKNFSSIAQQLTPDELVGELNYCFTGYDRIFEKYGIEKIKTIGDAYLCASGLPDASTHNPNHVIQASFELMEFLGERRRQREAEGKLGFDVRIGISTGPVVAGIVGIKKFAYDIWSEAVNTAARMEQHGVAGRINISETTYQLVKNAYHCTFRGHIEAKNIGSTAMYFVDGPV